MGFPIEAEYLSLREEIINDRTDQTNIRIAMCTISIAVLSFAFERLNPFLFLVVFSVILPFQLLSRNKKLGMLRKSAFIIVKYEHKFHSLSWQKTAMTYNDYIRENKHLKIYNTFTKFGYYIYTLIGVVALAGDFYCLLRDKPPFLVIISNIVFAVTCILISFILEFTWDSRTIEESYIKEFEKKIHS